MTNALQPPPNPVEWRARLPGQAHWLRLKPPLVAQTWIVARAEAARRLRADPEQITVEIVQ